MKLTALSKYQCWLLCIYSITIHEVKHQFCNLEQLYCRRCSYKNSSWPHIHSYHNTIFKWHCVCTSWSNKQDISTNGKKAINKDIQAMFTSFDQKLVPVDQDKITLYTSDGLSDKSVHQSKVRAGAMFTVIYLKQV